MAGTIRENFVKGSLNCASDRLNPGVGFSGSNDLCRYCKSLKLFLVLYLNQGITFLITYVDDAVRKNCLPNLS